MQLLLQQAADERQQLQLQLDVQQQQQQQQQQVQGDDNINATTEALTAMETRLAALCAIIRQQQVELELAAKAGAPHGVAARCVSQ